MNKKYDSTVARIAGNIFSGMISAPECDPERVKRAVKIARWIVAETKQTEPRDPK